MELHRFFRYAIEKMCKEKKSLNHFNKKQNNKQATISFTFTPQKKKRKYISTQTPKRFK